MKLRVDTTLPPAQFQQALKAAASRARAEHRYIRQRTEAYIAMGVSADTARQMAEAELALNKEALQ